MMLEAGYQDPLSVSIAKRMSWAANRTTSRIEDEAYSLFGIFGVNMPLLYGEGEASFIRLQEEIIKTSTDHSIFVWEPEFANRNSSIFATSPYDFRNGHNIVQWAELQWDESYEMTNIGLRVKLPIFEDNPLNFLAILNCRCDSNFTGPIALNLRPEGMLGHKTGIGEYEGSGREYSIRERFGSNIHFCDEGLVLTFTTVPGVLSLI